MHRLTPTPLALTWFRHYSPPPEFGSPHPCRTARRISAPPVPVGFAGTTSRHDRRMCPIAAPRLHRCAPPSMSDTQTSRCFCESLSCPHIRSICTQSVAPYTPSICRSDRHFPPTGPGCVLSIFDACKTCSSGEACAGFSVASRRPNVEFSVSLCRPSKHA